MLDDSFFQIERDEEVSQRFYDELKEALSDVAYFNSEEVGLLLGMVFSPEQNREVHIGHSRTSSTGVVFHFHCPRDLGACLPFDDYSVQKTVNDNMADLRWMPASDKELKLICCMHKEMVSTAVADTSVFAQDLSHKWSDNVTSPRPWSKFSFISDRSGVSLLSENTCDHLIGGSLTKDVRTDDVPYALERWRSV